MPWQTPQLREVRGLVRDSIRANLPGADAAIPNSVLRVMSDAQGALCHLTLQYVDWLALQLLPDTAETEWLDRHGHIWLVNSDGTTGRKVATLSEGTATFTGNLSGVLPANSRLGYSGNTVNYETLDDLFFAEDNIEVVGRIRAIDPGAAGNLETGTDLGIVNPPPNVINSAVVIELTGGTDTENDDDLRVRVLQRIRQPPQGGAAHDYIRWALAVPGCTRAWCTPNEMGMGTVTVRVLFDELRADDDGWPRYEDLVAATLYMDTVRPVCVKDFWVLAPIKQRIDVVIRNLVPDTAEVRSAIEGSLQEMLYNFAAPGQQIYAVWKAQSIMSTVGVMSFDLMNWNDDYMESPGHMAVLGDIVYVV
jgi:uncharacterized phage protein gp47/JayE